jgi:hypothetical protein
MENIVNNTPPPPSGNSDQAQRNFTPKKLIFIFISLAALALITIGVDAYVVLNREFSAKITKQPTFNADGLPTDSNGTADAPFEQQPINIASTTPYYVVGQNSSIPAVAQDFSISEIQNLEEMQKTYGITFTREDLTQLEQNKFIVKNLLDTKLTPVSVFKGNEREFVSLYSKVAGAKDYKKRTQANAVFVSSDLLMHLFSILSIELLKETENKYLYPQVFAITQKLYNDASQKIQKAGNEDRKEWEKVRNYFAIPYALLSTMAKPVTAQDYWSSYKNLNVNSVGEMLAQYQKNDITADSYERTASFVKNLQLDSDSEAEVLADIKMIYNTQNKGLPKIFETEYQKITGDIKFEIPYSLFKVRGSYTSNSLRRQYFRAVQWYQQVPFFTNSPELTKYALKIGELLSDDADILKQYNSISALLETIIGGSDDLDASDYAQAVTDLGKNALDGQKLKSFLDDRKPQTRIKAMSAIYTTVGEVDLKDVINATRGMRFFSQKFTPDSYWMEQLTQGDEKPAVNGMKLPRNVSSLQVMTILGSAYAQSQLPKLSFYPAYKKAIDTRLMELKSEAASWDDSYWRSNQTTNILWSIAGLFEWFQKNKLAAPRFMQSPLWETKTLMTGSAFWTELRHTNILYAKESFAEKGGGQEIECDPRQIPPPAQGYVEPQPENYDRLHYAARLLKEEYQTRGFKLINLNNLQEYIDLLDIAREYTKLELENTAFSEPTFAKNTPLANDPNCVQNYIAPEVSIKRGDNYHFEYNANGERVAALSRPEELRIGIAKRLERILPITAEGRLAITDKRAAVVADVHASDEGVVEEGTGVPRVIFVAIKDANGARLTIGFTYSHYEFLSETRLTDKEWQDKFYTNEGGEEQITYKSKTLWPNPPLWYQELLGTK